MQRNWTDMMLWWLATVAVVGSLTACASDGPQATQEPASQGQRADPGAVPQLTASKAFPFTQEEDSDGARFVWFVVGQQFPYGYVPARDFPTSKHFRALSAADRPRAGDIARWPDFVAIFDSRENVYRSARYGTRSATDFDRERGMPQFFRVVVYGR